MKKFLFIFLLVLSTVCFAKEKIAETPNSLLYKYSDWSEFYSDLVLTSKNKLYTSTYLSNKDYDKNLNNAYEKSDKTQWHLFAYKTLAENYISYTFTIISPNKHITSLDFINYDYRDPSKKKTSELNIQNISKNFDLQLTFFDEEVPMTLSEYLEKNKQSE